MWWLKIHHKKNMYDTVSSCAQYVTTLFFTQNRCKNKLAPSVKTWTFSKLCLIIQWSFPQDCTVGLILFVSFMTSWHLPKLIENISFIAYTLQMVPMHFASRLAFFHSWNIFQHTPWQHMVVMYCILIISDVAWFNNQGARAKVIKTIEGGSPVFTCRDSSVRLIKFIYLAVTVTCVFT